MPVHLKRITFKSLGLPDEQEPKSSPENWQLFAPCLGEGFSNCELFEQIKALSSARDQKHSMLALRKLVQIAAMGAPLTVHYDKKQCHELHTFSYKDREQVIWRIRHGDIRLPFYYGQGRLIFLAGVLPKRKGKLSRAEASALEREVKRFIDAEGEGMLRFESE